MSVLNIEVKARSCIGLSKLIHHSAPRAQYDFNSYIKRLNEFCIKINMTRKGNPYDNDFTE